METVDLSFLKYLPESPRGLLQGVCMQFFVSEGFSESIPAFCARPFRQGVMFFVLEGTHSISRDAMSLLLVIVHKCS